MKGYVKCNAASGTDLLFSPITVRANCSDYVRCDVCQMYYLSKYRQMHIDQHNFVLFSKICLEEPPINFLEVCKNLAFM
jgi:hypothetical protein